MDREHCRRTAPDPDRLSPPASSPPRAQPDEPARRSDSMISGLGAQAIAQHPVPMNPDLTHASRGIASAVVHDAESEMTVPRVWVVRADGGQYADHFFSGGYAAVGWFDLSSVDTRDQLRKVYELECPEAPAGQIANEIGQLAAFRLEMDEGDYVITPAADRESLRYGRIAGPCIAFRGDDGCRYRNRRAVNWAETPLRRSNFGESFQRTLSSRRTVFRIGQPEEFIAAIACPPDASRDDTISHGPAAGRETAQVQDDVEPDSGVEEERGDSDAGIKEPFDPSKIKVRTVPVLVDQLVVRIEHNEIDLAPDFQRMRNIWKPVDKSRLIESLLLRIPIPVFYVAADADENWEVADGVQRMSTLYDYVTGQFALTGLEYLGGFKDMHFAQLPRAMQRRVRETQLIVNIIEQGTPPEVMFNIFSRINTGGMKLNAQEIRHALHPGPGFFGDIGGFRCLCRRDESVDQAESDARPRVRFAVPCFPHRTVGAVQKSLS